MYTPKCQSKHKDAAGGCGDPKCPESSGYNKALNTAVANKDLNGFLDAQNDINMKNKPEAKKRMSVFMRLKIRSHDNILKDINNDIDFVNNINKTYIRQFSSFSHLDNYVKHEYKDFVSLNVMQNYPIDRVTTLSNIFVNSSLRGKGVGKHIVSMINATADHTNQVIVLEPALDEQGRVKYVGLNDDEVTAAHTYHDKLVAYYEDLGYEPLINYKNQINPEMYKALAYGGSMVRFPRNSIPENFKPSQ